LRGALGNLDEEIPHSGRCIHLKRLIAPPDAALPAFIDSNPKDARLVPGEVEGGDPEARAVEEIEVGSVEAGVGFGGAAVFGEAGGEREVGFG
jgi:hypothetical protein